MHSRRVIHLQRKQLTQRLHAVTQALGRCSTQQNLIRINSEFVPLSTETCEIGVDGKSNDTVRGVGERKSRRGNQQLAQQGSRGLCLRHDAHCCVAVQHEFAGANVHLRLDAEAAECQWAK